MDLSRYNKLISVVVGNIIAFGLVWLATKTPMAQCVTVEGKTACTLLGLSQAEITGLAMALITSLAVTVGPKNSVTPAEAVREVEKIKEQGVDLVKKVELNPSAPSAYRISAETGSKVQVAPGKPPPAPAV